MLFNSQYIANTFNKTIQTIRTFLDQKSFKRVGKIFFYQNKEEEYLIAPEAYALSFIDFPYWATVRFEMDLAKKGKSEKHRRICLNELSDLIREKVCERDSNRRTLPKTCFSFVRANERGVATYDPEEVHTHMLIKLHKEWLNAKEDIVSVMGSLKPSELSSCGIAYFNFEFNQDPIGRIAYVCKLNHEFEYKQFDFSKGFLHWIKKNTPEEAHLIESRLSSSSGQNQKDQLTVFPHLSCSTSSNP